MTGSHMLHIPSAINPDKYWVSQDPGATLAPLELAREQRGWMDQNLLPHTFLWGKSRQAATPYSKRVALNSFAEWTSPSHLSWERDFFKTI